MRKILILFALIALATIACAKKHRQYDDYYRGGSSVSAFGNYSNASSYGSNSYGSNSYGGSSYGSNSYGGNSYGNNSYGGSSYNFSGSSSGYDNYGYDSGDRRESTLDQVNDAMNNATLMQEQIDMFSGLAAMVLNFEGHQDIIRNYTRRIRNIVALIDVTAVRELVAGVSNQAFDSIRNLKDILQRELTQLNHSSDPINELNILFDTLRFAGEEEYHHLKAYLIEALQNITEIHRPRLSLADAETIADVSMLFEQLTSALRENHIVSRRGLEDIGRVLNLQSISGRPTSRTLRIENKVRLLVRLLLKHLQGINIDRLEAIANNAINATFERIHQLQQRALDVSRRALESHTPGAVLSDELMVMREGLGQSLVDFQKNLESDIIRIIRDLAKSTRFRGTYGGSIEVLVGSLRSRITHYYRAIRETVNDVDRVISRRRYGQTDE